MRDYRLSELDLSTRLQLSLEMLSGDRERGRVSQLAKIYGTSRKFLYELRDKGIQAIEEKLAPQVPGPHPRSSKIEVNEGFVRKLIICLSVLPPSLRNIQIILEVLFDRHCSLGHIQQTLQTAGERAREENRHLQPPQAVQGEIDEIYQNGQPCLSVVDGASLLALGLEKRADCDQTTWGVTLLDLVQQGVQFQDLAFDGAQGIRSGIRAAQLPYPELADLFHLFRAGHQISYNLEGAAYRALATLYRAQQVEQQAQVSKRRAGRPLKKAALSSEQAHPVALQAAQIYDLWSWLLSELQRILQPFDRLGRPVPPERTRQEFLLILDWMRSLDHPWVSAFAKRLSDLMEVLLAPILALYQRLPSDYWQLPPALQSFLFWAWQHRQELDFQIDRDLSPSLQPIASAFCAAMARFHRTSSLVECLHSWLRPFFVLHRGIPDWLPPLLQTFWNHHPFQRGKRAGASPLYLAGLQNASLLPQWLLQVATPSSPRIDISHSFVKVLPFCYPISALL
jgi:hypothetical protein